MGRQLTVVLTLALAYSGGAAFSGASAADEKSAVAVARLLQVGWGTTTNFRAAGDAQAEEMLEASGRQPSSLYALALVQMKQRRYGEAAKLIDELLVLDEGNLQAWRAKVWLMTILKNYDATMIAAEKLAELLPAEEGKAEEETQARQYVAFLGRMYGFLGGPAQSAVNITARKDAEKKLLETLSDNRRLFFEDARDGVLQKFVELTSAKQDQTDKAKEQADVDREKTLKEIGEQRDEHKERVKELQAQVDKAKKDNQEEISSLLKADAPLQSELTRLSGQAATLNRELFAYDSQIVLLQQAIAATQNPNLRQQYLFDLDRVSILESRIQSELFGVNRQASSVQAQRAALAARQQRADYDLATKLARIDDALALIAKKEKRVDVAEKRATTAAVATPRSALSLSAQAAALITYDPFPLEQEKSRILATLKR